MKKTTTTKATTTKEKGKISKIMMIPVAAAAAAVGFMVGQLTPETEAAKKAKDIMAQMKSNGCSKNEDKFEDFEFVDIDEETKTETEPAEAKTEPAEAKTEPAEAKTEPAEAAAASQKHIILP
jgi:hypothetical protein